MTAGYDVRYTDAARDDLLRLFEFLIAKATTEEDFAAAQHALDAVRQAVEQHLSRTPFIFRKAGKSPFLRELVIPFGAAGYVTLYEIGDATVNILTLRHQREDDYH